MRGEVGCAMGLVGKQLERDLLREPKSCGSGGQGHNESTGRLCQSSLPPTALFGCQGSQKLQRAIGRNRIRKEKLVLRVFPAGGGEEPSPCLQGHLLNSMPQKEPVLPHRNPMARRSCKGGSQQLARHCP